jgi:GT2 family glycosyltransferase
LVGGYDSIFLPVYFEDNDLELKIISRGYYIVAYPNAECIHYCGATYKYAQNDERIKRNKTLFGERWEKYFKNTEKRKEYLRKEWN